MEWIIEGEERRRQKRVKCKEPQSGIKRKENSSRSVDVFEIYESQDKQQNSSDTFNRILILPLTLPSSALNVPQHI